MEENIPGFEWLSEDTQHPTDFHCKRPDINEMMLSPVPHGSWREQYNEAIQYARKQVEKCNRLADEYQQAIDELEKWAAKNLAFLVSETKQDPRDPFGLGFIPSEPSLRELQERYGIPSPPEDFVVYTFDESTEHPKPTVLYIGTSASDSLRWALREVRQGRDPWAKSRAEELDSKRDFIASYRSDAEQALSKYYAGIEVEDS